MPEISVIIVNWNGKHFLTECLSALRRQTFRDFETILVDNGSNDGSAYYVRTQFPEVMVLALPENRGFTGGNIAGYERSSGQLIILLNNDTEVDPRWLEEIHRASQVYPNVGSFASKMMYFDERGKVENCGLDLTTMGAVVDRGRDEFDAQEWSQPHKVFGACGGGAVYRRQMLEDVGFLDADFFVFYEDVDLSFRAQLRGYDCVYVPGAIVYHRYRVTMGKTPSRTVFFSQRNVEFMYLKNMPLALILRYLPQRLLYEAGAVIYFSKQGAGAAFFRAKISVFRSLPSILRKRREIQKTRTISNSQLRAIMRKGVYRNKWKKFCSAWLRPARQNS